LGQGGMATVYLAEDLKHHRKVAIKVLRPELAATLGSDRFLSEIRTTAKLNHPHILALHDSGEAAGFLFYVMPLVEGESLRERMKREKTLPVEEAVRLTREVADALAYAHAHDVIHRDVKPENILLQSGHAVVADFGIARAVRAAGVERITMAGMAMGTPANMSGDPENEYFSDGISEEIINALTQLPRLRVAARTSAFSFKGKNTDLRTIGDQLNVGTVLEGSVRRAGGRIRITAQLVNVAD